VPAWNEAQYLPATLEKITAALADVQKRSAHRGQLIVVDNNSTDATPQIAARFGATVVFESLNQIARARNRGASAAKGDALVFVDADSHCTAELLIHVLDLLEAGSTVGGGSTIAPDKPLSGSALRILELWNSLATRAKLAAGCFIYCRKDAFDEVGGFSDKVYAGEEIYLSRALKRWGRRRKMSFHVATIAPVITSVRKVEWYSPAGCLACEVRQ